MKRTKVLGDQTPGRLKENKDTKVTHESIVRHWLWCPMLAIQLVRVNAWHRPTLDSLMARLHFLRVGVVICMDMLFALEVFSSLFLRNSSF